MAVNAARVSFGQDDLSSELTEKDVKLINYLVKHNHSSPMEHSNITFMIEVPLFVRSQHHRHRVWKFNEISRRYTEENIQFYEPKAFRTQHKDNRQASNPENLINPNATAICPGFIQSKVVADASSLVARHHKISLDLYQSLMEQGVCREQARGVLPQNLMTRYYGTCDISNLIKFITLRTHEGAQWEIQQVAEAMRTIATDLFPATMNAYNSGNK